MLRALILVCAAGAVDCDRTNAIDVMVTPVVSAFPGPCFLQGQAYLAQTELGRDLPPGSVVRIACERVR